MDIAGGLAYRIVAAAPSRRGGETGSELLDLATVDSETRESETFGAEGNSKFFLLLNTPGVLFNVVMDMYKTLSSDVNGDVVS